MRRKSISRDEQDFQPVDYSFSLLSDDDLYLFNEGSHLRLYQRLGSHITELNGVQGTYFAVWAPDAEQVFVTGDFNAWGKHPHPLRARGQSGIWEGFIPGVEKGSVYKYHIASRYNGYRVNKADPFALRYEVPPRTASVVWDLGYEWEDAEWLASRAARNSLHAPCSIYEVHLGSWMRAPEGNKPLSYRDVGPRLAEYAAKMGYTHVELLPIMEHPFYGSWGYQTTGYFAPTAGTELRRISCTSSTACIRAGIGVILDWVPSHFPTDEHGLGYFDGTHLYEHASPTKASIQTGASYIFNYGRNEVRSFLISSATLLAGRLPRRRACEWTLSPRCSISITHASKENGFRTFTAATRTSMPSLSCVVSTKRSTSITRTSRRSRKSRRPGRLVSRPSYVGGLGFGMKWDMGWMHDTLVYMSKDPIHRTYPPQPAHLPASLRL